MFHGNARASIDLHRPRGRSGHVDPQVLGRRPQQSHGGAGEAEPDGPQMAQRRLPGHDHRGRQGGAAWAVVSAALLIAGIGHAEARPRHHQVSRHHHERTAAGPRRHGAHLHRTVESVALGARPGAWCGWFLRTIYGGGPEYNLARNWAHRGRSAAPSVGAIVVWPHHVGRIVGRSEGGFIIQSGNDGGAVRTRPRSIAGAIAFRRI